jgi:hypothetical protein
MSIDKDLLDRLMEGRSPGDLFGKSGILSELTKALAERALSSEMDVHLDAERAEDPPEGQNQAPNRRNGRSQKTVTTDSGKVVLDIPRDRNGTFDPLLIAKYQRRFPEFDRKIVSMYARGMTTREIQGHIEEIYGVEASPSLISAITDAVMDEVTAWQTRPLEPCYPVVFMDAIRVNIAALAQPEALAVHLEDMDVVGQAVENGAGEALRAEDLGPFVEGQVRGDDDRAALVALGDDLEEQLGAGLAERHEAEFVDDQQLLAGEGLLQALQAAFVDRLDQLVDQAAAVVKRTFRPFWQAASPSPRATWVLPVPDGPRAMTFSRRSTNAQRASSMVSTLLSEGIALKSKLSRLLVAGNFAALMRRSIIRRSRSISSSSQSRSRYCTWSLPSAAHCRASLACSDWKVGSLSFLR